MVRDFNGKDFHGLLDISIGETVTIFTESGGRSGRGFTGVVLGVSDCVIRLVTCFGQEPCDPFEGVLGERDERRHRKCGCDRDRGRNNVVGSVVDIPLDKVVAFVHNAV